MQMGLSGEKIDSAKTLDEKLLELIEKNLEQKLKEKKDKIEEQEGTK